MMKRLMLLFKIVILLAIVGFWGLWYLNTFVLPIKGRAWITQTLAKSLNRPVTIQAIRFQLFKGIILEGVTIDDDPATDQPILSVESVHFNCLVLPIFKEKKLIIPAIHLIKPRIFLTMDETGRWNLPTISLPPSEKGGAASVWVARVAVKEGHLTVTDRSRTPIFTQEISLLTGDLSPRLPRLLNFRLAGHLGQRLRQMDAAPRPSGQRPEDPQLVIRGYYIPSTRSLSLHGTVEDVDLVRYAPYYASRLPVTFTQGTAKGSFDVSIAQEGVTCHLDLQLTAVRVTSPQVTGAGHAQLVLHATLPADPATPPAYEGEVTLTETSFGSLAFLSNIAELKGRVAFKEKQWTIDHLTGVIHQMPFSLSGDIVGQNQPRLDLAVEMMGPLTNLPLLLPPAEREQVKPYQLRGEVAARLRLLGHLGGNPPLEILGTVTLKDAGCTLPISAQPLSHVNGEISFENEYQAVLKQVTGQWGTVPLTLSGAVRYRDVPTANLQSALEGSIASLVPLLPASAARLIHQYGVSGHAACALRIAGPLTHAQGPTVTGTVKLTDGQATLPLGKEQLTGITGTVQLDADAISLKDGKGFLRQEPVQAEFTMTRLAAPLIHLTVRAQPFDLVLEGETIGRDFHLSRCEGRWHHSRFSLLGEIDQIAAPIANLSGAIQLHVADLAQLGAPFDHLHKQLRLEGDCDVKLLVRGPLKTPRLLEVGLKVSSPDLTIRQFHLPNVMVDLRMQDQRIVVSPITASPYRGMLRGVVTADLTGPDVTYTIEATVSQVDLEALVQDTNLTQKEITGLMNASLALGGSGASLDSLRGRGWIEIHDGNLWQTPLLKGIGAILFPELKATVFTQAAGNLIVANRRVATQDLTLSSEAADLAIKGSVGFDQTLDAVITIQLAEFVAADQSRASRIASTILNIAGRAPVYYRITGTVQNPRHEQVVDPARLLDTILQGIRR